MAGLLQLDATTAGYVQVTPIAASMGNRVQNLQDAAGTLALLSAAQTWTGTQDFSGATLVFGAAGVNAIPSANLYPSMRALDGLAMPNVKGYLTNTPPGSPSDGDCYIIGAAPTGAWAGQASKVTRYSTAVAAWEFFTAKNGWTLQANTLREMYRFTASAWEIFYQEGTWTPAIAGSTTPGVNTYSSQVGLFTKIGRIVNVNFNVSMTAKDGAMAGSARIVGLPFVQNMTSGYRSALSIGYLQQISFGASMTMHTGYIDDTTTQAVILAQAGGAVNPYITQSTDIQNTTRFFAAVNYMTS